jgi:hypothetical protein
MNFTHQKEFVHNETGLRTLHTEFEKSGFTQSIAQPTNKNGFRN